jgi:hypothetical protein
MNAAMPTMTTVFLFQTFDIKILNADDIEVIDIHPRELT